MYKLIRRISSSFFPRPDRPWSEDATSTAPQIGRKRRLTTPELDEREAAPAAKKHRLDADYTPTPASQEPETETERRDDSPAHQQRETEEVKEVTKGVGEVELADGEPKAEPSSEEMMVKEAELETEKTNEEGTKVDEAAAVPLPDSPRLKAAEGEDADADGEIDTEPTKEIDDASSPAEVKSDADASPRKTAKASAPVAIGEDEVPGLTLANATEPTTEKAHAAL